MSHKSTFKKGSVSDKQKSVFKCKKDIFLMAVKSKTWSSFNISIHSTMAMEDS